MRNSVGKLKRLGLIIVCIAVAAAVLLPLLSNARSRPVTSSITVVNSSSWEIRHLYLSAADQDNWGPDQLSDGTVLHTGDSYVLNNVSCDAGQIKVVSEDKNGCFLSAVVSCTADATWTITNNATPNCGN
jgi:hypothetical protein